ncbi:MAG: glycosyltransferase family 4 protein [Bacteroidota bacterium]
MLTPRRMQPRPSSVLGRPVRVLMVHNFYQQPGGEDQVFRAEVQLLEAMGHTVQTFTVHNDAVDDQSRATLAARTLWNRDILATIVQRVRAFEIDVVHFHNTLPLISPAAYHGARKGGAAVVQTLHNYRLHCPGALYFREGKLCESCLGKTFAWPGVRHGCYRGSKAATAVVATMTATHRLLGTWTRMVDRYIALTQFAYDKFIEGGLPAEKLALKPNFMAEDPGPGAGNGAYALFVGRLSPEKGIDLILDAWTQHAPPMPLVIAGDGPRVDAVKAAADLYPSITWVGHQTRDGVIQLMADAALLVFSSECYEGGTPMTIIESMANGTPVVASDLGGPKSMLQGKQVGARFTPGDPAALAATVAGLAADTDRLQQMRATVRGQYELAYTAEANYHSLTDIYDEALTSRHAT